MQYIEATTGLPVSLYAIRSAHPHVSIPDGADLTDLGYAQSVPADKPALAPGVELRAPATWGWRLRWGK